MVIYIEDTTIVTKSKAQKLRELRADYSNLRDMIKDLKAKQKLIRAEIKAVKTTKATP
jgi:prefoldin subunit 5